MSNFRNSSAGTAQPGRFQCRINGKPYYIATPAEAGQSGPPQRMWKESRTTDQGTKAEPFYLPLSDLSQGAGFSYSYDKLPQVYAWSAGFDAWAPGIISTRAKLTTGATFTSVDQRGWQFTMGGYLYVCRGRYVVKYLITPDSTQWAIVSTRDLETLSPAGSVVCGRPVVFKGKAYIPVASSAGVVARFQEMKDQTVTTDTWTLGPAAIFAKSFRVYLNRLARLQGDATAPTDNNRVYFCEADPMVAGNWSPSSSGTGYEFGQNQFQATDAVEFTPYLVVGKENGVFLLDDSYQSHNAIGDFENFSDAANFVGMEVAQGEVAMPGKAGLVIWDGSSYDVVGLGQEGFFNPTIDRGDGRFYSLAPAGELCYWVANDTYNGYAIFGSYKNPEARRFTYGTPTRAKVWQTYEIEASTRYESVIVLSTAPQSVSPKTPATFSDSSAVGTVTWSLATTGPVTYGDGIVASATTGTTHYLKGLGPPVLIPTGATVTGVSLDIAKSAGSSLTTLNDPASGFVTAIDTTYSKVVAGSGSSIFNANTGSATSVGQHYYNGFYTWLEAFYGFDTSSIPDGATVLSATLTLTGAVGQPTPWTSWTMQARLDDWSTTVTTADWVIGANLSTKTLLATLAMAAQATDGTPLVMASQAAFISNINKTGVTRIMLVSDRQVSSTTPTTYEYQNLSSATLTVTYSASTVDAVVKLVIAGAVTGTNLGDAVTVWPTSSANYTSYGGATTTWGGLPTVAQANDAANFGFVISATVGTADTAMIDHARMTVFYTLPTGSQADTATLLSVLSVDSTHTIAHPVIYQLPRNAIRATYDPQLPKARDNATFQTSRYHEPGRNLQKTFDSVEFYAEMSASNGTGPPLNVKYSFNDTDWAYLLNSSGGTLEVGAALGTAGAGKVTAFFPRTSASWAYTNKNTVALQFVLGTISGAQVYSSVVIRDILIKGFMRPTRSGDFSLTLLLGELEQGNSQVNMRTVQEQLANLRDVVEAGHYPLAYQAPDGRTGYAVFGDLSLTEATFTDRSGATWPTYLAVLTGNWLDN